VLSGESIWDKLAIAVYKLKVFLQLKVHLFNSLHVIEAFKGGLSWSDPALLLRTSGSLKK